MTISGNGKGPPYKVIIASKVGSIIKSLHAEALTLGRGSKFLAVFHQMVHQLRFQPIEFGEPLYNLPALRVTVRQAMIAPLVIDYGVHNEKPLVFVNGFKVLWPQDS